MEKNKVRTRGITKKLIAALAAAVAAVLVLTVAVNVFMCASTEKNILSPEEAAALTDVDHIIVLGAKVNRNGTPSHMLEDRIIRGVEVYNTGVCRKLLMSGDSQTESYDEISVMKSYAEKEGVPAEDIYSDRYGISTYDSMYRLKSVFGAKKVIVVTQKYHLYRALYILNSLGVECYGVSADLRPYASQAKQDTREVLARVKDFFKTALKPDAAHSGNE